MLKIFLSMILPFSLAVWSMDKTDSDKESLPESTDIPAPQPKVAEQETQGITIRQASDFLYGQWKIGDWEPCTVFAATGFTTIFSALLLGTPGSIIAGIYCQNHPNALADSQCENQCALDSSYPSCLGACRQQYPQTQTLNDPVCITGLGLVSFIGLSAVATACYLPIAWTQHWIAQALNARSARLIRNNIAKGHGLDEKLADSDMHYVGPYLVRANSDLLRQLSAAQTLGLAEVVSLGQFTNLTKDIFTGRAKTFAYKLIGLLGMDLTTLAQNLHEKKAKELFRSEPVLWQTMVRLISRDFLQDPDVKDGLNETLQYILDRKTDDQMDVSEIVKLVSEGAPISNFQLSDVLVDEHQNSDIIELITKQGTQQASKKSLSLVSKYFESAFSGNWSRKPLNLTHIDDNWVSMVLKLASGQIPDIFDKNLSLVLGFANYFQTPSVLTQCDLYIKEHGLLKQVMKAWSEQPQAEECDVNSFADQWRFCNQFSFEQNKRVLAAELLSRVNKLTTNSPGLLAELRLLTQADVDHVIGNINLCQFNDSLTNPIFLGWLWNNARDISFLRDAMVMVCGSPHNNALCEQAWPVVMPKELKAAIIARQSKRN